MKRTGIIACLTILIVMLASSLCFAAEDFKIVQTYPADGDTGTTKDNMCVKVYFNKAVGNKASREANKGKFKITDENGKEYPTRIYYNDKNDKYVLFLIDTTKVDVTSSKSGIKDNTEYTAEIDAGFVDNEGVALGDDPSRKITFRTINQGRNTLIYMVMMFLMFGGMMFFSMRQAQNAKKKEEEEEGEEVFNPYKEAKKTGRPVEELIAEHQKEVEKKEKARQRKEARKQAIERYRESEDCYHVQRRRPIAEAGCTYKTGRKAAIEQKKAEEEAKKAELRANNYQKKPKNRPQKGPAKKGSRGSQRK
ncbi:MAG: Ig-like domain-containing protein [Eubacterium sp.]|nr:Ig-like domain-containing protein [Eubacterium sp.]